MKKLLILITALTLLTACSGDDSPGTTTPPEETALLLKKIIETSENGETTTYTYNYENNKLKSIVGTDNSNITYTYVDNLITGKTVVNNILKQETVTKYNDENKMISVIHLIHNTENNLQLGLKELYTYNEDGTTTVKSYQGNLESQTEYTGSMVVSYPTENTLQHLTDDGIKIIYTFDGKNNPRKTALETNLVYTQNLLTGVEVSSTQPKTIFENTYIYNSKNYPISSTEKILQMDTYKITKKQFFYE